jgi:hypothetical protein
MVPQAQQLQLTAWHNQQQQQQLVPGSKASCCPGKRLLQLLPTGPYRSRYRKLKMTTKAALLLLLLVTCSSSSSVLLLLLLPTRLVISQLHSAARLVRCWSLNLNPQVWLGFWREVKGAFACSSKSSSRVERFRLFQQQQKVVVGRISTTLDSS